jgi:repressor LexA
MQSRSIFRAAANHARRGVPLTLTQQRVLAFLQAHAAEKGFPPTRKEIAAFFGWKSANAAEDHLRALARKGAIEITRTVRGIKVLQQGEQT